MTSLSDQLRKLAVPQTSNLINDTIKPSLLFDPKEASSIDRDSFYAIGVNGLEELELLDSRFSDYHKSLFSESSKKFERSVHSKSDNEDLNKEIKAFLLTLSPYLLLKPSHKAFEWLVHRFHIQSYNVDEIMQCALPYHNTNIFVRIVQLLDLKSPSHNWHWLHAIQKPGVPLAKTTLLTRCFDNLGFLKFVCNLVSDSLKICNPSNPSSCKTVINFYLTSVIGALENAENVSEELVSLLLPYIVTGLKSSVNDYVAATYMILCQLARKIQMKKEFFKDITYQLISNVKMDLLQESIGCLCVLFQLQSCSSLTIKCLDKLQIFEDEFIDCLTKLSNSFSVSSFALEYSKASFEIIYNKDYVVKNSQKSSSKLISFLQLVSMNKYDVIKFIRFMFDEYINSMSYVEITDKKKMRKIITNILSCIERMYPDQFDAAVQKYNKNSKIRKLLLKMSVNPILNIHHLNTTIRKQATVQLVKLIKSKSYDEKENISDIILTRIKDDDAEIIKTVLSLQEDILMIVEKDLLVDELSNLLLKNNLAIYEECDGVNSSAVKLLCHLLDSVSDASIQGKILTVLLSFMYIRDENDYQYVKIFESFANASKQPLFDVFILDEFKEPFKKKTNFKDINSKVLNHLKKWTKSISPILKHQILSKFCSCDKHQLSYREFIQNFVILNILLGLTNDSETHKMIQLSTLSIQFLHNLVSQKILQKNESSAGKDICQLSDANILTQKISFEFCKTSLIEIVASINVPSSLKDIEWWIFESPADEVMSSYLEYSIALFDLISVIVSRKLLNDNDIIQVFQMEEQLDGVENLLKFLSMILFHTCKDMAEESTKLFEHKIKFVQTLLIKVLSEKAGMQYILQPTSCVVPILITCLNHTNDFVRSVTIDCLAEIPISKVGSLLEFDGLISYVVNHKEEIINDKSSLVQMLPTFYSSVKESPRSKCKIKSSFVDYFLHVILNKNVNSVIKINILDCLSEINSYIKISTLEPFLSAMIKRVEDPNFSDIDALLLSKLLSSCLKPATAQMFTSESCCEYKVLKQAMSIEPSVQHSESLLKQVIELISKDFFASISSTEVQQLIFNDLLLMYSLSLKSSVSGCISHCLKKISLDAKLIINEIKKYVNFSDIQLNKFSDARKAKKGANITSSLKGMTLDENQEKKIIIILETVQLKKKIKNISLLIPILFNLLQQYLSSREDSSEYIKQLIMSAINHCCDKIDVENDQDFKEEQFNMELVIECLRTSKSSQTQHQSLILLKHAAKKFPDHVLHCIMSIFTFMGENIVKKDDKYSFQIINDTIETIIPIISQHEQKTDNFNKVSSVIQVFIDALPDIPLHRRELLFTKLLNSLSASNEYMYVVLIHLFGHVVDKHEKSNLKIDANQSLNSSIIKDSENEYRNVLMEFGINLCLNFPVEQQLWGCENIISFLASLPEGKEINPRQNKKAENIKTKILFDMERHSDKQLRHLKFQSASFVSQLLSSSAFITQVAECKDDLEFIYQKIIKSVMVYIKSVSFSVTKFSSQPSHKFWKVLLNKCYDIIDKINGLLPSNVFVNVINNLMSSEISSICRKSMEILNSKLQFQPNFFDEDQLPLLLNLVPQILRILSISNMSSDIVVNKQTALYSLKLLTRICGHTDRKSFLEVLDSVLKLLNESDLPVVLQASSLLCIAELIVILGPHMIASLPDIIPFILNALNHETNSCSESLLLSALITVQKLMNHLANFISPYLQDIIIQVALLSTRYLNDRNKNASKSNLQVRLDNIQGLLSSVIPPRILLPAIDNCYNIIVAKNVKGIQYLMQILAERIKSLDKAGVSENFTLLEKIYLNALNFRSLNQALPVDELTYVEGCIIESFLSLVLKLSETSFRPFFFKLFNWATQIENKTAEVITFYRLSDRVAETLKALFVLFAGNIVKHASKILEDSICELEDETNPQTEKLIIYILDTLYKCFLYDHEGFVNKERFETMLLPLVNQLENFLGSNDVYEDRVKNHLSPCLAQFAVAVGDDISWKQLNYQVLLKTRHSLPKVRCSALMCTLEICKKLGDEYTSLLPETIPFLAELMEDESFEVESKCQEIIAEMEAVLGESLQSYF